MITRIEDIADWLLEAGTGRASLLDLTREVVQKIMAGELKRPEQIVETMRYIDYMY